MAFRRRLAILGLSVMGALVVMSAAAFRLSIITGQVRMLFGVTLLACALTALAGVICLGKRRPRVVLPVLASMALLVLVGFATGGNANRASMRSEYVNRLKAYDHVRYVWGGETRFGIDCSGLARTALWETMLGTGTKARDWQLISQAARFWSRDLSAADMLAGTHGYTRVIGRTGGLTDPSLLRMRRDFVLEPGDLAVAGGGSHVLIYVGDDVWIEANPEDGMVVQNQAKGSNRSYFRMPATILRWWVFGGTGARGL